MTENKDEVLNNEDKTLSPEHTLLVKAMKKQFKKQMEEIKDRIEQITSLDRQKAIELAKDELARENVEKEIKVANAKYAAMLDHYKNMNGAKVICFSKTVAQPIFGYVKGVTKKPFGIDPVLIVIDPSRRCTAQIEATDIVHEFSNELAKAILTMDFYQTWLCHHAIGSREDFMSGKDQYKFLKEYKFISDDFVINFETPEQAFLRGERVGAAAAAKEFTATSKKKPSARDVEDIVPSTNTTVTNSRKLNKASKLICKNVVAFQKGKLGPIYGTVMDVIETSENGPYFYSILDAIRNVLVDIDIDSDVSEFSKKHFDRNDLVVYFPDCHRNPFFGLVKNTGFTHDQISMSVFQDFATGEMFPVKDVSLVKFNKARFMEIMRKRPKGRFEETNFTKSTMDLSTPKQKLLSGEEMLKKMERALGISLND